MSKNRFYEPQALTVLSEIILGDDATKHINVLRLKKDVKIILFNGDGSHATAKILEVERRHCKVLIMDLTDSNNESPLHLHLGQVISRGDRMEWTIQKAVELGVNEITPLISERCGVKLSGERLEKKLSQWQKIAISACEQSGRNVVPKICSCIPLKQWCEADAKGVKLTLHPRAEHSINTLPADISSVSLLIGPEGGFTDEEIMLTEDLNFIQTLLGPRVLRTETAAIAAITALQCRFGDLA